MAVRRALVYQAGTVGMLCAATEVAIERGSQDRPGTITPIRVCTNPATVEVQGTHFCDTCGEAVSHSSIEIVERIERQ